MLSAGSHAFQRQFVYGLFLLARSFQLSVDRASPGEWGELVSFLNSLPCLGDVANHLLREANLAEIDNNLSEVPPIPSERFGGVLRSKISLNEKEIIYIASWLMKADELVKKEQRPEQDQINRTRLGLAAVEELMRNRLPKSDARSDNVVHYNQNPSLDCQPIERLVGGSWL